MPGAGRSDSRALQVVGAVVAVVAVLGWAFGGWSFSTTGDGLLPLVIAVLALVIVVGSKATGD